MRRLVWLGVVYLVDFVTLAVLFAGCMGVMVGLDAVINGR